MDDVGECGRILDHFFSAGDFFNAGGPLETDLKCGSLQRDAEDLATLQTQT